MEAEVTMSGKGRILEMLGGLALTDARVVAVDTPHPRYRKLSIEGPGLRDGAFQPGDKVQVLLPSKDVRTYTPVSWKSGRAIILAYLHGTGPGARWAAEAKAGDTIRFLGPQRSLRLDGVEVLAGDETSIGVAAGLATGRTVLRVADVEAARAAAASIGVNAQIFASDQAALDALGSPRVAAVTGGSAWIQAARAALRERGANIRVKAYWAPGRVGID